MRAPGILITISAITSMDRFPSSILHVCVCVYESTRGVGVSRDEKSRQKCRKRGGSGFSDVRRTDAARKRGKKSRRVKSKRTKEARVGQGAPFSWKGLQGRLVCQQQDVAHKPAPSVEYLVLSASALVDSSSDSRYTAFGNVAMVRSSQFVLFRLFVSSFVVHHTR